MVGIYRPDGSLIVETVCKRRKGARQGFAAWTGMKWGDLWEQGYRCRAVSAPAVTAQEGA